MPLPRSLVARNLLALCFLVPLSFGARAAAEEACGDTVCPKGFTCETYSLGCPDIACAEGSSCAPCEPEEESVCVPGPCSADSDCAAGMVCATETREECEGGAPCATDPGDAEDPRADDGSEPAPTPDGKPPECEVEPENCTTVTVSSCVPRWALPCETAADCGPGFTCEELLQGGCSGSEGSAGGGTPGEPGEPTPAEGDAADAERAAPADGGGDCFFEPSGVSACVPVEVGCTSDADCAEGWTCDANHEGACWASSDGTTGCDPVDPPNVCYPPYYDLGGGFGGNLDSGGSTSGGPVRADDEAPSGENGASADSDADEGKAEAGGCSVSQAGGTTSGFGLLLLSLAGLFAARRRVGVARR